MRRTLHYIAFILAIALIFTAAEISRHLPADTHALVEKKYSGWSGVLRGWICSRWNCSHGFITWLNHCAAEFEKAHPGVYLEFTEVSEAAITEANPGMRVPELIFYSPGVVTEANLLREIAPVCMGGYIWVYNRTLCAAPPDVPICLPDDGGRSFSLAAAALQGNTSEISIEDPGIDLGLVASASTFTPSLDAFIEEEIPALIISQKELGRLISLRDQGKGPDWQCAITGEYALADQLLLCGVSTASAGAPADLATEFRDFLRSPACQAELTRIGAFPAVGEAIYPAHSPYAQMEAGLRGRKIFMPDFLSEYPPEALAANVRKFMDGLLSPELTMSLTLDAT